MNKLYYFLMLLPASTGAQVVTISDSNFRALLLSASPANQIAKDLDGNFFAIDANGDGQIQPSEALQVSELKLGPAGISSITGIAFFENLVSLQANGNVISHFDLSPLDNIVSLSVDGNNASLPWLSVSVSGGPQLSDVTFQNSNVASLDMGGIALHSIHLSNLEAMHSFMISGGDASGLHFLNCPNLINLNLFSTDSPSLSLHDLPALVSLAVSGDESMQSINVQNCPALAEIDIDSTPNLQAFAIDAAPVLESLIITNSGLTSLDLSAYPSLESVDVGENELQSLNLQGLHALASLDVGFNQLTTLDLSSCTSLASVTAISNPLEQVFAKNGSPESIWIDFVGEKFICVDDFQVQSWLDYLTEQENAQDIVVSSYCTFTPGGNYNTITGNVRYDANANGCDTEDQQVEAFKILVDDGTSQEYVFAQADGSYAVYAGAGNYTLTAVYEHPSYFASTSATASFASENGSVSTQDLCFSPNGTHADVEVILVPVGVSRPGFDASYEVLIRNKGNAVYSGSVALFYEDSVLDFLNASEIPSAQTAGILEWNFADLQVLETRSIALTFSVNAPTDAPAVNIGDVLDFTASVSPADENPQDNSSSLSQEVVGSYDPNDKICLEGSIVSPDKIGDYLHYAVNFENTGTFPAENVVIADVIDTSKFDLGSFQLLSASHPNVTRITGDKAEFIFESINLGIHEHGHVVFKIKTKDNLAVGSAVTNKASIFFDYNFPIETNEASTTFQQLSTGDFDRDNSVAVYPNPTSGVLNAKAASEIKSISVFDAQGRIVKVSFSNEVGLAELQSGVYIAKIVSEDGISVQKVSKK